LFNDSLCVSANVAFLPLILLIFAFSIIVLVSLIVFINLTNPSKELCAIDIFY
jgi:hypothetical protein